MNEPDQIVRSFATVPPEKFLIARAKGRWKGSDVTPQKAFVTCLICALSLTADVEIPANIAILTPTDCIGQTK